MHLPSRCRGDRAEPKCPGTNISIGTQSKMLLTGATGQIEIELPRDREGSFDLQIVKKSQRRWTDVDEIVFSLCVGGDHCRDGRVLRPDVWRQRLEGNHLADH